MGAKKISASLYAAFVVCIFQASIVAAQLSAIKGHGQTQCIRKYRGNRCEEWLNRCNSRDNLRALWGKDPRSRANVMNITETLMHDYRDINKTLQLTNSLTHTYLVLETLFVKDASHSADIDILQISTFSLVILPFVDRRWKENYTQIVRKLPSPLLIAQQLIQTFLHVCLNCRQR